MSMSLRTRHYLPILVSLMFVVAACQTGAPTASPTGTAGTPEPTVTGTAPTEPTGTPAETTPPPPTDSPEPTPPEGGDLIYPTDGQITHLNNALSDVPTSEVVQWIHSALYRYNDALEPVPDLAADMPQISEDGLVWTVTLVDNATFQPTGEPVTADDVVFTYEMSLSPNCRFNPDVCLSGVTLPNEAGEDTPVVASVVALDERTVEFTLNFEYAPFLTAVLPGHLIDSQAAVEEAFAAFQTGTEDVTVEEVQTLSDAIAAEQAEPTGDPDPTTGEPTVNLEQFQADLEDILGRAEVDLPDAAAETYLDQLVVLLTDLLGALQADEANAIAAAYPLLSTSRAPVGAGPFFVSEFAPGQRLTLTANEGYHHGAPALEQILVPIITEATAAVNALQAGDVDWVFSVESDQFAQIEGDPNIKIAEYADFAYFGVQYNLHPDQDLLFADPLLRQAAEYCIDKPAMVEAATVGQGITIWADIPPASWAYNPNVPTYSFDPEQANALIVEAGWTMGDDGVYMKDGRRLATHVPLRAGRPDRAAYMQLWSDSLNTNCGFEITLAEYDFGTQLIPMLSVFPHNNPGCPADPACGGSVRPFEAYFGGWGTALDPDPRSLWHSSNCSTEEQPDTFNYICFQNDRADELIDLQSQELDIDQRREYLWEFENILATELPYSFAWSPIGREGLRQTVNQTDLEWTPDVMDTPTWFWEQEKITNIRQ